MSGYIGIQPVPQATQSRQSFTATAGQTSFATAGYTAGFLDVYLNGVHLLDSADYTATNGSDVVLTVSAAGGDVLEVVSYSTFEVLDPTFTGTTTTEALTVTGAFTSKGIDDNATATAMTLDASGNLLVGTTDSNPVANNVSSGVQFGDGRIRASRADRAVLELNRKTSDGSIAEFRKDGTTVGSIGSTNSGANVFFQGGSGKSGIEFGTSTWVPWYNGARSDSFVDLGGPTLRFKDLYLSSGVYLGGTGSANLLDDYETGTWTPTLTGYTGVTYNNQLGWYVKSGGMITIWFSLNIASVGTYVSNTRITGAPFSAGISTTNAQGGIMLNSSGYTEARDHQYFALYNGSANIYIYSKTGSTRNGNQYQAGELSGQITYRSY